MRGSQKLIRNMMVVVVVVEEVIAGIDANSGYTVWSRTIFCLLKF